ncbi:hypothetical protein JCM16303_005498 [Sporobolomyces ruberrimus]
MSPPTYEPIPQEKPPPLEQDVSVSKEELIEPSSSSQPRTHLLSSSSSLRSFLLALMWTLCILTFASIVIFGGGACMGKRSSGVVGSSVQETVNEFVVDKELFGNWKWWEKRSVQEDEGEYSTSTLRDGSTQTFVFTTRPIVNPGGYTIGTLTGYVPVPTTSSDAGPTTTTVPASSKTPTSTRSASTIPHSSSSHIKTSSLPPRTSSSTTHNDSWSRVSTTSIPPPSPTSTYAAPPPSASATQEQEEFDFSEVDYHLLHRRGLDFEQEPSGSELEEEAIAPSSTITSLPSISTTTGGVGGGGVEEFSTSTDRKGELYTLVKTTRPIVNPGGYTIGTLDGGWVDVNKIKPTSTVGGATVVKKSVHEELKKRQVVQL